MEEKKEFPKGEFSGFGYVLECSKTWYVFSPWLDSPNAPTLSIAANFQNPLAGPSFICHDLAMVS